MKRRIQTETSSSIVKKIRVMIVPVAAVAFLFSVLAAGYITVFPKQKQTKPTQDPVAEMYAPGRFYLRVTPEALPHIKGQEWVDLEKDIADEQLRKALKNIQGIKVRRISPTTFENRTLVLNTRDGKSYDATQEFALYTDLNLKREDLQPFMDAIPSVQTFFQFSKIKLTATGENAAPVEPMGGEDPMYADEWRFHRDEPYGVNMEGAWDFGVTGEGIRIGFIDDSSNDTFGVENHPDLSKQISEYKSENSYSDPNCLSHGALTSQQTLGVAENGIGSKGGAYNAQLIFNNIAHACGLINEDHFATMLDLAATQNLDILNMSISHAFNTTPDSNFTETDEFQTLESKISAVKAGGTAIFASAGNENWSIIPNEYSIQNILCFMDGVVCLGATNREGYRASEIDGHVGDGSTYGPPDSPVVLIGSPAVDIPLFFVQVNKIFHWGGTSSAAPIATTIGALAAECVTSLNPHSFTNGEDKARTIQNIVLHNTRPMQCPEGTCPGNGDEDFPNGILDAAKAVESACSDQGEYSAEVASPIEAQVVGGALNVKVVAPTRLRGGIEFIELYLDDAPLPDARRAGAFDHTLDTTSLMNGDHVFHAMTRYMDGVTFFSRRIHVTFDNFGNPGQPPIGGGYNPPPADPGGPSHPEFFHAPESAGVVNGIIPVKAEVGGFCRIAGGCDNVDKWNIFVYANGKKIGYQEHIDNVGAVITFMLDTTQYDDFESIELMLKEEELDCMLSTCWTQQEPFMTSRIFVTPYNSDPSENTPLITQPGTTPIDIEEGSGQSLTFQVSNAHPEFMKSAELWFYSQYAPDIPVKIATDTTAPFIFENIPVSTWGTNKYYTFYSEMTDIYGVRLSGKLTSLREVYVNPKTCTDTILITSPRQNMIETVGDEAMLMWGLSNPCHAIEDIRTINWYVDNAFVVQQSKQEEAIYSTGSLEDGDYALKVIVAFDDGKKFTGTGTLRVEHNPLPACTASLPMDAKPEANSEIKGITPLKLQQPVRSDLQWVRWQARRRGVVETIQETTTSPYDGRWSTYSYANGLWEYRAIGLLDNAALSCSGWRFVGIDNLRPTLEENIQNQVE